MRLVGFTEIKTEWKKEGWCSDYKEMETGRSQVYINPDFVIRVTVAKSRKYTIITTPGTHGHQEDTKVEMPLEQVVALLQDGTDSVVKKIDDYIRPPSSD